MTHTGPLLTILVPTYNRAGHLRRLLDHLATEVVGTGAVAVHVSDNASSDDTRSAMNEFQSRCPEAKLIFRSENVGPDENFCGLVESVESPYFWLLGDDDVPRTGAITQIVNMLEIERPDTVYLDSTWMPEIMDPDIKVRATDVTYDVLSSNEIARRTHVWTTFMSSWIVSTDLARLDPLRRFTGTSLVQLGWVYGAIARGAKHLHVHSRLLFATSGNTGGYSALTVFGANFPKVVRAALPKDTHPGLAEAIIGRSALAYLPGLTWQMRQGTVGDFRSQEQPAIRTLQPADVGGRFWLTKVLVTISEGPKALALPLTRATQVAARIVAFLERARTRKAGRSMR